MVVKNADAPASPASRQSPSGNDSGDNKQKLSYDKPNVRWNPPPDGFDPLHASPEELARYYFPPRPDGAAAPRALANWARAMSPPLSFVRGPISSVTKVEPWGVAGGHDADPPDQEWSKNWSGAYIRPGGPDRFHLIEGMWIVPRPYPPPGYVFTTTSPPIEFGSSAWVGLDGHDPTSMSLPQIGTAHFFKVENGVGQSKIYAWWQWWVRNQQDEQVVPLGLFPVEAGDLIYCRVEVTAPAQVNLFIKNQSAGAVIALLVDAPVLQNPPSNPPILEVQGRTADWILERPTIQGSTTLFTLPNYGSVLFYACNAAVAAGGSCKELQLERARYVRMVDWDDPTHRGQTVSTAVPQTDSSILVCYRGNLP